MRQWKRNELDEADDVAAILFRVVASVLAGVLVGLDTTFAIGSSVTIALLVLQNAIRRGPRS